ncbi:PH domain-containing protein [Halobium salinum]|uniref:PH domain-containing protein n=1 Tax=Halobium salinum TaxID=1364940 RepID=A0ABD5PHL1_9EURY|nr:PH domain-containing protein [Halobium salinum]
MTRGRPALWSAALGGPLLAVGAYLFALQSQFPLLPRGATAPPAAGAVLALFGVFVVGLGLYVQYVAAPAAPTLRPGESIVDTRDPAQRNALAQATLSLPLLGVGFYLLYATTQPYLVAGVPLAVGLYLFSTGLHRYWRNTLTTYLLTDQRVMEEYRFLSLVRNEVPLEKVRAVEERQSMWDALFGLGRVYVRAGATGDLTITVGDVYDSTPYADEIRAHLGGSPERANGPAVVNARSTVEEPAAVQSAARTSETAEPVEGNVDTAADIVADVGRESLDGDGLTDDTDAAGDAGPTDDVDAADGGDVTDDADASGAGAANGAEAGDEPSAPGGDPRTPNPR